VGRLRAALRLAGSLSYYLVIVAADNNSIALSAPNAASAMLIAVNSETPTSMNIHTIVNH
jgi:hypothetical protein